MNASMIRRLRLSLLFCLAVLLLSGCRLLKPDDTKTSMGVDDGIEGFLFNFDQRDAVSKLVSYQKKGQYPTSVTWYYQRGGPERKNDDIEKMAVTSTDPEKIETIYFALSNSIILGTSNERKTTPTCFISFIMPDGEECRFDFISEMTIRLSQHNYVTETDGSLWPALDMSGGEAVSEAFTEAETQ